MTSPLISVAALAEALASERPPVLVDVRWNLTGPSGHPAYLAGHLPGAHWVDLEQELSGPVRPDGRGGRHPLPDPGLVTAALRRAGVRTDTPVVAYDAGTSLSAARLWWLLTDGGHPDVRVLDGGVAAWTAAGLPVEQGPGLPVPAGDVVLTPGRRSQVDAHALGRLLTRPGHAPLVDVRAAERYSGDHEPVDPVAGHIPGAVNLPATGNLRPDGRFRSPAEIADRYAAYPDPILYCGSGVTAAQSLLALESAGLTGRIYPGSWSDWISDPDHPVARGADPDGGAAGSD